MKHIPQILNLVDILVMVVLVILIAVQNKSSGLSTVFGGGGGITQTRRGFEKWLFYTTIVFGILFVGLNIASLLLRNK